MATSTSSLQSQAEDILDGIGGAGNIASLTHLSLIHI